MKKLILCAAIATLVSGCTTRLVDFTIISSKNIDMSRGADFKRHSSRATGEDFVHIIVFIPTGVVNAKEALDRAIESVPGAVALLDGVLTYEWFYIPYIYGQQKYIIEGTPLIDPSLRSANENTVGSYNFVYVNKDGKIANKVVVSKEVFDAEAKSIRS